MKNTREKLLVLFIVVLGIVVVFISTKAWTAPTQNPPLGNVGVPVNTSAIAQTKTGPLTVSSLTSGGNIVEGGAVLSSKYAAKSHTHSWGAGCYWTAYFEAGGQNLRGVDCASGFFVAKVNHQGTHDCTDWPGPDTGCTWDRVYCCRLD